MNRIRYKKLGETQLESVQVIQHPTTGQKFKVFLNVSEEQWAIIDTTVDTIAATGSEKHLYKMKKDVKKALEALGVSFTSENRKRERETCQLNKN